MLSHFARHAFWIKFKSTRKRYYIVVKSYWDFVNQSNFCPYTRRRVSVPTELLFGLVRYFFERVPPQPNSQVWKFLVRLQFKERLCEVFSITAQTVLKRHPQSFNAQIGRIPQSRHSKGRYAMKCTVFSRCKQLRQRDACIQFANRMAQKTNDLLYSNRREGNAKGSTINQPNLQVAVFQGCHADMTASYDLLREE